MCFRALLRFIWYLIPVYSFFSTQKNVKVSRANQWTGFYMIWTSVIKELNSWLWFFWTLFILWWWHNKFFHRAVNEMHNKNFLFLMAFSWWEPLKICFLKKSKRLSMFNSIFSDSTMFFSSSCSTSNLLCQKKLFKKRMR